MSSPARTVNETPEPGLERDAAGALPGRPAAPSTIDWHAALPELELRRVRLREPRSCDAPSLCEQLATDEVARFMSRPPSEPAGFERFIAWLQAERAAGRCFCFGIVPQGHERAVGLLQVRQLEPGFGSAEWGFAIGRDYWGTGVFVESATATVDFAFRHAGAYRLEARTSTENGRGNGALAKLGATQEGVLRQSLVGAARPMDQLLWSMHAEDWLAAHAHPAYRMLMPSRGALEFSHPPRAIPPVIAGWRSHLPTYPGKDGTLRDLELTDAPELFRRLSDPDVQRFIPPSPSTVEGFEQFIAWAQRQRDAGKYACFGIVPPGSEYPVGIFQVRQLDPTFRTAEWGFVLAKPYWGSGLFLAGAVHVLDFAFDTLRVHRLEARAAVANGRGNGALRKLGATLEGHLRRSFLLGGVYHDDALWALLADDWRRLRPSFAHD